MGDEWRKASRLADYPASESKWIPLGLNPGTDAGPVNPVCPDCGDPIKARQNDSERRFVCGCERLRLFRFEKG